MRGTKPGMIRTLAAGLAGVLVLAGAGAVPARAAAPGPAFVNAAIGGKVANGSLVLPRPAGTSAGDVLIAGVAEHEVGAATAPSGWKLIRQDKADHDVWLWLYYRVAGPSEPSRYVWKVGDDAANGAILAYRAVDTADPIVASAGHAAAGGAAAIVVPSMQVGSAGPTRLVMFTTVEGPTPNPITPPAGFSERTERDVHPSTESSDMLFTGSGATGSRTAKPKFGGGQIGHIGSMVALRPARQG
jgi:hypothetical protein